MRRGRVCRDGLLSLRLPRLREEGGEAPGEAAGRKARRRRRAGMSLAAAEARRRRRPGQLCLPPPEPKHIRKSLDTVPEIIYHLPRKYPVDYWDMEWDLKQKRPTDLFDLQIMKEKPSSMIFPDNETVTTAQPCPRCIAGEPGHLSHIMGL